MTNQELISTLKTASASVNENIALAMLLLIAAERIESLDEKVTNMGWELNPDRMGR